MTANEFRNLNLNDIIIYNFYNSSIHDLTIGKKYIIIYINKEYGYVKLIDDYKTINTYNYFLFTTLKEYEILHREDKIKKILK